MILLAIVYHTRVDGDLLLREVRSGHLCLEATHVVLCKVNLYRCLPRFQLGFQKPVVAVLCIYTILVVAEEGQVLSKAGSDGRLGLDNAITDRLVVMRVRDLAPVAILVEFLWQLCDHLPGLFVCKPSQEVPRILGHSHPLQCLQPQREVLVPDAETHLVLSVGDGQEVGRPGPLETGQGHLHVCRWVLLVIPLVQPNEVIRQDVFLALFSLYCDSVTLLPETRGVVRPH